MNSYTEEISTEWGEWWSGGSSASNQGSRGKSRQLATDLNNEYLKWRIYTIKSLIEKKKKSKTHLKEASKIRNTWSSITIETNNAFFRATTAPEYPNVFHRKRIDERRENEKATGDHWRKKRKREKKNQARQSWGTILDTVKSEEILSRGVCSL